MQFQFFSLVVALLACVAMGFSYGSLGANRMVRNQLVMRERKCDISGKSRNSKCMNVSKSNAHTHKVQNVNLQTKKLFWEEGNKFVKVRISTKTLKTIQKNGLHATAKKYGVDLNKFSISSGTAPAPETVSA